MNRRVGGVPVATLCNGTVRSRRFCESHSILELQWRSGAVTIEGPNEKVSPGIMTFSRWNL